MVAVSVDSEVVLSLGVKVIGHEAEPDGIESVTVLPVPLIVQPLRR